MTWALVALRPAVACCAVRRGVMGLVVQLALGCAAWIVAGA